MTISRTPTKANYISTGWALNLSDGTEAGGDWHHARWFSMEDRQSHGPELFSGETVQVLAEQGIYDCRAALRRERHPQGWRAEPVWAARYTRACVDMIAMNIARVGPGREPSEHWWRCEPTTDNLSGWQLSETGWTTVLTMCRKMAQQSWTRPDLWAEWARRRERELVNYRKRDE